ncbi:MAG: glycoside hydrolase family 9 protein [Cyanobacteria bacterium J06598_1]
MAKLQVTQSHSVNSNILALRIETGKITRGTQVAYTAQPGDKVSDKDYVRRDGKNIGRLLENGKMIRLFDQFSGADLDEKWATNPANFKINGTTPKNVFIKSKVGDSARVGPFDFEYPMEHTVYLEMPEAMSKGQSYQVDFQGDELADINFTYSPETVRSEAVHVSHLGFNPKDPSKIAFLSTWMGKQGQGLSYEPGQKFWLIDDNGKKVFEGEIELSKANGQPEDFLKGSNYSGTDVYVADFSEFEKTGSYKVAVEDVGTSFDFKIGNNTWEDAFQTSMEGLFVHRSGIAKTKEFSDYTAPRNFSPKDGVKVYQSTAQFRYTDIAIGDQPTFEVLKAGATDEVLDFAWGGWADAGDWDRNTNHLSVSRDLLELGEMFPEYFMGVDLTIPESGNNIADVIDEALWGVDFFQRMQREDGGVRGGIESEKHPKSLEASWQESWKVMAYAPDAWTSYQFAGVAARAANLIKDIDPARAKGYEESAIKAMEWAEKEQSLRPDNEWRTKSHRNLAAAELYRTTGASKWHDIFLADTAFTQPVKNTVKWNQFDHSDAAFVYAQTNHPDVNKTVQANAKDAILKTGDFHLDATNKAAFRWSKNPYVKIGFGANDGFADRVEITRAHFLSQDEKYLKGAIDGAQFQGGANPDNVSYTTGIGPRDPDNVLFEDGISMGVEPPKGISIYGPVDLKRSDHWALDLFRDKASTQPEDWPTAEGFFDVARYVAGAEYTVTETIAPTAYSWGYLAANNATNSPGQPPVTPPTTPPVEPPVEPPTTPPVTPPTTPPVEPPIEPPVEPPTTPPTTPPGTGEPTASFKYEAESLKLDGFRRKGELKGVASGNKYISLGGSATDLGSANGVFKGPAGTYKVSVSYFDESDGHARASFSIGGQKKYFKFKQELGSDKPSAENQTTKMTHPSVVLEPGDTFELSARRNGGEQGSIDYIVFDQLDATPQSAVEGVEDLMIDLTQVDFDQNGQIDDQVNVMFETSSKAWFDNTVGFYVVDDERGAITDPISGETTLPGEEGYRQKAIANRLTDLDMTRESGTLTTTLEAGQILAPFLVANDTPDGALARTQRNMKNTYFAFEEANMDGVAHIRTGVGDDGEKTFGFEDHWNGGNQSFNDVIVKTEVTAAI